MGEWDHFLQLSIYVVGVMLFATTTRVLFKVGTRFTSVTYMNPLLAHAIFDDQLHLRPCAGHDLFEYSHLFFCCLHQTSLHKGYHNQNAYVPPPPSETNIISQIQEMEIYPDGHLHWYL